MVRNKKKVKEIKPPRENVRNVTFTLFNPLKTTAPAQEEGNKHQSRMKDILSAFNNECHLPML